MMLKSFHNFKRDVTPSTIHLAEIPYLSRSSSGFPDLGRAVTASTLTIISLSSDKADETASPIPP